MTIARAIRMVLTFATACVVAWSFGHVGVEIWKDFDPNNHKIKLTVLHWGDAREDNIMKTLVGQYEQEHPNIEIERINASDYDSKLKMMLAAGTPPDVFYLRTNMLPDLATMKLVRPVDDYVQKEQEKSHGAFLADFYPILLDSYRYDGQQYGKGPLYGLPKDFTTAVFYVNVNLFNAAGIPVPYDGWTWDEFERDMRKITDLRGKPGFEGRTIYGGFLQTWSDTIRNIMWTYGGDFFGRGGFTDVALGEPREQEALNMIYRLRMKEQTIYNPTGIAKDGGQEFLNGNIGCLGPIGRWPSPTYKTITSFKWDVVPVPYKEKKWAASEIFMTSWSMSATTKHPDECFELMKFLCGPKGAAEGARLGLAIPPLKSIANSSAFLSPPGYPPIHTHVFLDAVPLIRIAQNPPQQEWDSIFNDRIGKSLTLGEETPMQSAEGIKQAWLNELNSPLRRPDWPPMNWTLAGAVTAVVFAIIVGLLWTRARREKLGFIDRGQERAGWTFIAPWLIGFLALTLGPMIVSLLLSFTQWTGVNTMDHAQAVGSANYRQLLTNDPSFYQALKVTIYFVVLAVPISQIAALAVALLMNLKLRGIAIFRTIYFVPSVISGVALAVLWLQIFNNDYGLLNQVLRPIVHLFGASPPDWFGRDARIWAIPAFVIMGLWGVGGGMIIYLAGLKGIPASLYEAATIDGAGWMGKLWNVTLPMLSPLIFYNAVMGIIGSFQVFTQAYVMTGPGPDNSTLFYVLDLFRQAFLFYKMGYASAMAWVLFIIVLGLTILVFRGSRKLVYYEGLKA